MAEPRRAVHLDRNSGPSCRRDKPRPRPADREPGELSSGSGSDDPDSSKPESITASPPQSQKRKFSPIVWDRTDSKQPESQSQPLDVDSGKDEAEAFDDVPLPPLPEGLVPRNSVERSPPEGLEPGQVEEVDEEDDYFHTRKISASRWADGEEDNEVEEYRRKKTTPVARVREGSDGSVSRLSDFGGEDGGKNDNMSVDEEDSEGDAGGRSESDEEVEEMVKTPERVQPPQRSINMLQGCRSVDEFERLNKIDEGTYGVVYRAKDKKTGEVVALKKVKMEKEREGFPLTSLREINILLSLHHPSIVDVKEVVVGSSLDSIFMVMEYMDHDLKGLMETMKQPFSQSEVKCLMLQLLEGVNYLHDNWVLHRDLKTSNLLFSNRGELKICDFGLSRQYGSPLKPYTPLVVTLWYRSPELLLGVKEYSTAIDMWSLGCIMAELLAKEPLFNGKKELDQLDKIFKVLGTPNEKIWPGFSQLPGAKFNFVKQPYNRLREKFPPTSFSGRPTLSEKGFDLLNKLLTYDPEKRITAETALKHEWFQEVPLPKSKDFMPTFPAQHAQDRKLRRVLKSPDPLEEQRLKELQGGIPTGSLFS